MTQLWPTVAKQCPLGHAGKVNWPLVLSTLLGAHSSHCSGGHSSEALCALASAAQWVEHPVHPEVVGPILSGHMPGLQARSPAVDTQARQQIDGSLSLMDVSLPSPL